MASKSDLCRYQQPVELSQAVLRVFPKYTNHFTKFKICIKLFKALKRKLTIEIVA